jgi:hypothetical protein
MAATLCATTNDERGDEMAEKSAIVFVGVDNAIDRESIHTHMDANVEKLGILEMLMKHA